MNAHVEVVRCAETWSEAVSVAPAVIAKRRMAVGETATFVETADGSHLRTKLQGRDRAIVRPSAYAIAWRRRILIDREPCSP